MAEQQPICNFGWKGIDAELMGTDGKSHRILEQAGENGLVVVFICNHCPYVKAVIDRIAGAARDLREHGVGFVAINSNDAKSYPEDSFDNMKTFAAMHELPFPYLHDEDQSVARKWGAVCTPDFFGLNAEFALQYRGRLDAAKLEPAMDKMHRDLYEAMVQIARTGVGPHDQTPSIGCSIKWKEPV